MKLDTRMWAIISVLLVGAIVAGGWFLGASPLLVAKADADGKLAETRALNAQHAATLAALADASKTLPELQDQAVDLESAIPTDLASSALITALNDLAAATGVTITAIAIQDGVSYQPPADAEAAPAAADSPEGAPTPLTDARITSDNFVLVPITVEVAGALPNVLAFIHGVQTGTRLVLITGLDTSADGDGATTYTSVISGTTYVLVRPPALQVGAALTEAAAEPTPSPTPTESATPTPTPTGTPAP